MMHRQQLIQQLNKLDAGGLLLLPVVYQDERNVRLLLALTQHRHWTLIENIGRGGKSRFSVRRVA